MFYWAPESAQLISKFESPLLILIERKCWISNFEVSGTIYSVTTINFYSSHFRETQILYVCFKWMILRISSVRFWKQCGKSNECKKEKSNLKFRWKFQMTFWITHFSLKIWQMKFIIFNREAHRNDNVSNSDYKSIDDNQYWKHS